MNGPIRTVTIDSNTPEPPNNGYYVTVTLPVWIADIPPGVTIERVEKLMAFDRWDEGRYPFHEELVQEGLKRMVQYAFRQALNELLHDKYGNESVPDEDGRGHTARWHLESEKIKGPYVQVEGSVKAVKIEQQCGKCRGNGKVSNWTDKGREEVTCGACNGTGIEK
jgi:hypothetical protein